MAKKAKKHYDHAGAPTKYKSEYATDEFLAKYIIHCRAKGELVSLCGFACYVKVCEDTLQEWRKVHKEFSVPLNKLKQLSKQMLINKGLKGTYNSTIAKLVLSSNHGMVERKESILGGKDGKPILIKIVNFEDIDNDTE